MKTFPGSLDLNFPELASVLRGVRLHRRHGEYGRGSWATWTRGQRKRGLLAAGDVPGLVRYLRADGVLLPLEAVASLVAGVGRLVGCDDLARTASAIADGGDGSGADDVKALYDFGCECVDHEIGYLAVGPLARALGLGPDVPHVLGELVTALEQGRP